MDITQIITTVVSGVVAGSTAIVSVVSLIKALKSEKRTKKELNKARRDVEITQAGIVEAFKKSVITKDVKVSINKQVERVLDQKFEKFEDRLNLKDAQRTQMTYWCIRILQHTAAANKLTMEQQAELEELLLLVSADEQIVDTFIK